MVVDVAESVVLASPVNVAVSETLLNGGPAIALALDITGGPAGMVRNPGTIVTISPEAVEAAKKPNIKKRRDEILISFSLNE